MKFKQSEHEHTSDTVKRCQKTEMVIVRKLISLAWTHGYTPYEVVFSLFILFGFR